MFRRKSIRGAQARHSKIKKAVKRLITKPSEESMAAVAVLAVKEHADPLGVSHRLCHTTDSLFLPSKLPGVQLAFFDGS